MKRARNAVFAEQDKARLAILDERARLVRQAKERAAERVAAGKDEIAVDAGLARAQLEAQTSAMAESIVKAIFEQRPGPRAGKRGRDESSRPDASSAPMVFGSRCRSRARRGLPGILHFYAAAQRPGQGT